MWDVRVCAACLATEVRMFSMSAGSLLEPYRLLTGIELDSEGMPQKLCWECAALVRKFNMFRHKCERAGLLLQEIYNQHDEVSVEEVLRVNREQHNLISSYSICSTQVYNLELKIKSKICHKDKMSEVEKINDSQSDNALLEPFIKVELEIIKKEEVPIEIESELNDTELIHNVFVEEDCSQAVQLESPQTIKCIRKRRQGLKLKGKRLLKARGFFIEGDSSQGVLLESPQTIKRVRKRRQSLKPTKKRELKVKDIFIEKDYSQGVHLESPQKIKRVRKIRQGLKPKRKRERKTAKVLAKDFGMKEELLSQEQQMEVMREKQNTKVYKSAPFPCKLCYIHFSEEKAFNNHMLKHDPVSGEFICDLCKLRYKSRLNMCRHMYGHHMKRYSCQSCPSVFYNRSTANAHYAWHNGVVYTCRICSATFNKKTTHQSHLRLKHPSEHVCDQCGEPFHSKKGLLQHINMTHKLKRDTVASGGDHETSGPYCAECDTQFTCKQAWTRHILISPKHRHERHICALGCATCGETLADKESLRAHRVIHRPSKTVITAKHNVNACKQSKACMKHRTCKHTSERRFMCDMCSKRFTTNQLLHIHIRSHTKELPYKCHICGRGFSSASNFYRHRKVHTDVKPYACETCGKCFKARDTVKAHVEYVHLKKPWPKRDRSQRQNVNEKRSRRHKRSHEEAVAQKRPQQDTERQGAAE